MLVIRDSMWVRTAKNFRTQVKSVVHVALYSQSYSVCVLVCVFVAAAKGEIEASNGDAKT